MQKERTGQAQENKDIRGLRITWKTEEPKATKE